tara:strand:+ start:507 stop:734 length:228 start_codon:yes stop_codon:yes gene_type:complete
MSDVYKISKALEDMRNFYELKKIKHVTINMEDPADVYITFVSNKPRILDKLKTKTDEFRYKLSLSIMIDSIFPEE